MHDDQRRGAGPGEPKQHFADEPRSHRAELRRRLIQDEMPRPYGQQGGDDHELRLAT